MKRFTVELPNGYDECMTITAMGQVIGLTHVRTNVTCQALVLDGHDGETLVIYPNDSVEWRKPTTATWEWFEEHSGRSPYDDDDIFDFGWRCSCCKTPLAESVGGYWIEFDNKPDLKFCPECGERMVV